MKVVRYLPLTAAAAAAVAVLGFTPVDKASADAQIGVLKCHTVPGTRRNYIIRSTADVDCIFDKKGGGTEKYVGETGIAIGASLTFKQTEEKLYYTVAATTTEVPKGALAGKYLGGQVDVAVKKGAGGAVMVGGGSNQFSLAPMGTTEEGYGLSAGVGFLYIEPAK